MLKRTPPTPEQEYLLLHRQQLARLIVVISDHRQHMPIKDLIDKAKHSTAKDLMAEVEALAQYDVGDEVEDHVYE